MIPFSALQVVLIWRDHSASLHKDFSSSKPKSLDELLPESQKAKNKHKKKAQGQVNLNMLNLCLRAFFVTHPTIRLESSVIHYFTPT